MSKMTEQPRIEVASENAIIVYLQASHLIQTSHQIAYLKNQVLQQMAELIIEVIPSYNSLLIVFDPFKTDVFAIKKSISNFLTHKGEAHKATSKVVELPVYYSQESGPDLTRIAEQAGLTVEQVIEIHQAQDYQVFALGFAPGFAFLGEVDKRISTPRLATPRKQVPKGAVGIADRQTAIYPASSPGGWNLIGLCPTMLFDPTNEPHVPFNVGDTVKFAPVTKVEFEALGGRISHAI